MNLYDKNLESLKLKNEYLYEKICALEVDERAYTLTSARNSLHTVKVNYSDGLRQAEFFIHSKYDPMKEAENFAQAQFEGKASINILYGFGFGYHVEAILQRLDAQDQLYIIDLNLHIFKLALEARDLSSVISDSRARLIISDDEKYVSNELRGLFNESSRFCVYPPSMKAIPLQCENFKFILEDWNIKKSLSNKWTDLLGENYEINRQIECDNVGILFRKYDNRPIVIVSAGPSLNRNKHLLKELKGKALLFSVGSALKSLLSEGVEPDFFCIIDPQPITYKQIEGLENLTIPLVFLDTASAYTVSKYKGPKYVASNNASHIEDQKSLIDSGGSVATAIMDMAIKFGGNPIIFVGQDLAFTDNRHHAIGDMYGEVEEVKSLPNMRKVKGQKGEILDTTLGLLSFKRWIENKIRDNEHIRFINATEGGAFIEGCRHMSLESLIDELEGREADFARIHQLGNCDENTVFVLMGMSKTSELKRLYDIAPDNKIIIVEPDIRVCNNAATSQHLKYILSADSITVLTGENIGSFRKVLEEKTGIQNHGNIKVIKGYDAATPHAPYFKDIEDTAKTHMEQIKMHAHTIGLLEEKMSRNLFQNLPYIINGYSIEALRNAYDGIPAIIVSAGPSLEKNIGELRNIKGEAIIMAGVRTVKPLAHFGIRPHFILNIDPNDIAYELAENYLEEAPPLITLVHGNHRLIEAHKGSKLFIGDAYCRPMMEYLRGKELEELEVGGSVANAALSVAYHMGCNPIIFVGQDLAYTDDKLHSDIASQDRTANSVKDARGQMLMVKDIYGREVRTDHSLLYFLRWFEKFISQHSDRCYINATEGGADIAGTSIMRLAEAIGSYCNTTRVEKLVELRDAGFQKEKIITVLGALKDVNMKLNEMRAYAEDNMRLAGVLFEYYNGKSQIDLKHLLDKMDENDERLKGHVVENSVMHYFMQKANLDLTLEYAQKLFETAEASNVRISKKNMSIYEAKVKAIEKSKINIEEVIRKFENIMQL